MRAPTPDPAARWEPGQTIVFLGDSITAARPGWVDLLAQVLAHRRPDLRLQFVNAGVPGDTIRELATRLQDDVFAYGPAWVLICIGANDYYRPTLAGPAVPLAEFTTRYGDLVGRIVQAGARPVLLTIPVVGLESETATVPDPGAYNDAIRRLAAERGVPLVDVYRAFRDVYERATSYKQTVSLTTDGLHPNHQGAALMARSVIGALDLFVL